MSDLDKETDADYKKIAKQKSFNVDELTGMSNKELVDRIVQLEAHNRQLKNLLQKKYEQENNVKDINSKKRRHDFSSYSRRHVLLKLYYLGWDCQGFVTQEETSNTIEYYLFQALVKCCLIEKRETSNYQRCGRTDKGVSAFCQVISIDLKSKLSQPNADNCCDELPYLTMLNRLLPEHIRCYAWAHVDSNIGARFECSTRAYQYYFPKGDLNIPLMQEAAKHFIGEHDFRNFCKMDVGNGVTKFIRNITFADIKPCTSNTEESDYSMYKLVIQGNAFLWHQIRCIMAVLLLIGQRKESPDIIKQLLNVSENPTKPQYTMASHVPLTLFLSNYENCHIKWNVDDKETNQLIQLLQRQWTMYSVKEVMVKEMIDELSKLRKEILDIRCQAEPLLTGKESKVYKPLLLRMKCASLEDRIQHYVKRRRIIQTDKNET